VLAEVGRDADMVTTDTGISLAMWSATETRTRLEWALKRPGKPWTHPKVKGDWKGSPYTHGQPQLTTSSRHRVMATWLDARRRVVVEDWSPTRGWSKPKHLSGRHQVGEDLRIVSNADGKVAVSWASAKVGGGSNPLFAMAAVRRDGAWLVRNLGSKATTSGHPKGPIALGMDAQGAVSAAWYDVLPTADARAKATRLAVDATAWEPVHDFGFVDEYFNEPFIGLAVQPDGAEIVNPEIWFPEPMGVFTRVGDGSWTDQGDLPFVNESITTPTGGLVTWENGPLVYEDPDGVAGPEPFAALGRPDFPRREDSTHVFVTSEGTLVAMSRSPLRVVYAVRPAGGDWSATRTAYATKRIVGALWSADMTPDGLVTIVVGTRRSGTGVHSPLRLEAIRFDATPEPGVAR
jgi:hypothetical protein